MANVKTGRHLKWDTADTTGIPHTLHVVYIAWLGTSNTNRDIAADDDLEVTDAHGAVLFEIRALIESATITPKQNQLTMTWPSPGVSISGIKVPQIDGGELFVWVNENVRS